MLAASMVFLTVGNGFCPHLQRPSFFLFLSCYHINNVVHASLSLLPFFNAPPLSLEVLLFLLYWGNTCFLGSLSPKGPSCLSSPSVPFPSHTLLLENIFFCPCYHITCDWALYREQTVLTVLEPKKSKIKALTHQVYLLSWSLWL